MEIINALVKVHNKLFFSKDEGTLSTWKFKKNCSTPHSLLRLTVALNETVTCMVHISLYKSACHRNNLGLLKTCQKLHDGDDALASLKRNHPESSANKLCLNSRMAGWPVAELTH